MHESRSRQYWLGLSLAYGISLSVLSLAPVAWALTFVPAVFIFVILQAMYYGQIGRHIQRRLATATPGVGALAMVGGAAALLVRGSAIVYWAGPLLSVAGVVVMYLYLNKFGKFHTTNSTEAA